MQVKICGLFRPQDITYVNEAKPDYAGFVFAKSKRQVTKEQAKKMSRELDKEIIPVGVFVDAPIEQVAELLNEEIIAIAQLHGAEDNDYIEQLRSRIGTQKIIKAIRVRNAQDVAAIDKSLADYVLFDAYSAEAMGGTGTTFDWSAIGYIKRPFFLAGGISIDNVKEAASVAPFALDISSGVETNGIKDRKKILEIVNEIRTIK